MNAEKEVMTLAEIFDFNDGGHDKRPAASRGAMSLGHGFGETKRLKVEGTWLSSREQETVVGRQFAETLFAKSLDFSAIGIRRSDEKPDRFK